MSLFARHIGVYNLASAHIYRGKQNSRQAAAIAF